MLLTINENKLKVSKLSGDNIPLSYQCPENFSQKTFSPKDEVFLYPSFQNLTSIFIEIAAKEIEEIDLTDCDLNKESSEDLALVFGNLPASVEKINLSFNNFTKDQILSIFNALSNKNIKEIDLSNCRLKTLTNSNLSSLFENIPKTASIINISGNDFSKKQLITILKKINNGSKKQVLLDSAMIAKFTILEFFSLLIKLSIKIKIDQKETYQKKLSWLHRLGLLSPALILLIKTSIQAIIQVKIIRYLNNLNVNKFYIFLFFCFFIAILRLLDPLRKYWSERSRLSVWFRFLFQKNKKFLFITN